MELISGIRGFVVGSIRIVTRGNALYWAWIAVLLVLIGIGAIAWLNQLQHGLITTNMRDQVTWAFYIGNFTFLVGVASAAVLLVIPAYLYRWPPIKEVVVYGELLAIAAVVMCCLFVLVDVGRPDRVLHLVPGIGLLNVPSSLLGWDVIVLNGYLALNLVISTTVLFAHYRGKKPPHGLFLWLVLLSIPWAIGIHTVTAFLYSGLVARPFWNSAILAPRFIASAFCSGPAVLLIMMEFLRRFTRFHIQDAAIHKIAELMAYAMCVNLFLLGAEVFTEGYADSEHAVHLHYLFFGIGTNTALVPYIWTSVACSVVAVVIFLVPRWRKNLWWRLAGCLLIYTGVYIEKGMGLVMPGLTPDPLGEIYEYGPTWNEVKIAAAIFSAGFLVFTLMVKVTNAILDGSFRAGGRAVAVDPGHGAPKVADATGRRSVGART